MNEQLDLVTAPTPCELCDPYCEICEGSSQTCECAPQVVAVTPEELVRLQHLEGVVARGLSAFVEVGNALREIRDSKLYRETHPSFEDYVGERWGISRTYAYDLIGSSQVVERLSAIADVPPPSNEAQARELVPLLRRKDPELIPAVWRSLHEEHGADITARVVKVSVARIKGGAPAPLAGEYHPRRTVRRDSLAPHKPTNIQSAAKIVADVHNWIAGLELFLAGVEVGDHNREALDRLLDDLFPVAALLGGQLQRLSDALLVVAS